MLVTCFAKIGVDRAENEPCKDLQKVCKILQDFQKVCKKLQVCKNLQFFCNIFGKLWKFQESFKNFQRFFFKNSAAWWSLLVVEKIQNYDWKFSDSPIWTNNECGTMREVKISRCLLAHHDFSHFWEKNQLYGVLIGSSAALWHADSKHIYIHTKYHCNWMKNAKIVSDPK